MQASSGIGGADLCLELADGFPQPGILEQQPRLQFGLGETEVRIDRHGVRVDVEAYRTCQQSRALRAEEHSPRWNEHQPVGAIPHGRDRQPFDGGLGVIANAQLDSDEQVTLLFETIFEGLMVDDLHGLGAHATPACGPVSDNVGWKEINRLYSAIDQVGCGNAFNWIVAGGAVHAITSCLHAVVELSASISPELVTDI